MLKLKELGDFDWWLFFIVIFILMISAVSVYSASIGYQFENNFFEKHLIWIALGIASMFFFSFLDFRIILKYSFLFYLLIILLLIYTHYEGFGSRGSNVSRWIKIFGFTVQPSEFAKLSLVFLFAQYYRKEKKIGNSEIMVLLPPVLITIIPFFLILLQPDLGTSLILLIITSIVLFLSGISWKWIAATLTSVILSIPFLWVSVLKDYQKERILILFDPQKDPLGAGYHIIQSKIAIGSGWIFGKGFLEGKQAQLNFLPARHTDFIFSVFSEEWGFLGSFLVVMSYCVLVFCILRGLSEFHDRSAIILILGVAVIIGSQAIINISMVTGLLPVVGLPLPLMSYGGSSMITTLIAIGIVLNVRKKERNPL